MRFGPWLVMAWPLLLVSAPEVLVSEASASEPAAAEAPEASSAERHLSPDEVQAWLERPVGKDAPDRPSEAFDAIPPPAPRRHGLNLESSIGALAFIGPVQDVSPLSPWFGLKLGFEPWSWLSFFASADVTFSSTSSASPPPPTRTYRLYAFGGGVRLAPWSGKRAGVFAEGDAGVCRVDADVLQVYGFQRSTELRPFVGGRLGMAWYPLNPHLSLALTGGLRSYLRTFEKTGASGALSILSAVSLRYTF